MVLMKKIKPDNYICIMKNKKPVKKFGKYHDIKDVKIPEGTFSFHDVMKKLLQVKPKTK
jgi:hypothetical protein